MLLSDEMLDLSKDVEIHTNGHLSFRGRVEPDASAILEEARRFKDRRLVFVNRVTLEVDEVFSPEEAPPPGAPAEPGGEAPGAPGEGGGD